MDRNSPMRNEWLRQLLWAGVAAGSFHLSYASPALAGTVVVYLFALLQVSRGSTWRRAFYPGLAVGLVVAAGRLDFFYHIFSFGAVGLWLVFAFWVALFVLAGHLTLKRLKSPWCWGALPILWVGLEYFRSELYYLRFAWLSPGFAFAESPANWLFRYPGVYGIGLLAAALACLAAAMQRKTALGATGLLAAGTILFSLVPQLPLPAAPFQEVATIRVSGVQMEFPDQSEVLLRLNEVVRKHPDTDLIVLSEYTFPERVPKRVLDWCRDHKVHLIVGGKEPADGPQFYNTAYVISPDGEIVFQQAKTVPIQFFKDGLPAARQQLWNSPWGKLGICICYDLSYSRVTDELVSLGAQGLIVPTMDVIDWGQRQHVLHGRVAPVRAAEYGLPLFRLASSGISQLVDHQGTVLTSAPCPGEGVILHGTMRLPAGGAKPLDRWLALFAVAFTGALMLWFALQSLLWCFNKQPDETKSSAGNASLQPL